MSLLAPLDCGAQDSYWKAPPSSTSVEFVIVLNALSDVSGVILLVSPCGYSEVDAPTVSGLYSFSLLVFSNRLVIEVKATYLFLFIFSFAYRKENWGKNCLFLFIFIENKQLHKLHV